MTTPNEYAFMRRLGRSIESGAARTIVVCGDVQDLFRIESDGCAYVPLVDFLTKRCNVGEYIPVAYELNRPIRFVRPEDHARFRDAWVKFQSEPATVLAEIEQKVDRFINRQRVGGLTDIGAQFDRSLEEAAGNPTLAFQLLRWMCECSRARGMDGQRYLARVEGDYGKPWPNAQLTIIIDGAHLLIPEGQTATLSEGNLRRVAICREWFSDLGFLEGGDTVILITESRCLLNAQVSQMPQLAEVTVPSPDEAERLRFIRWFEDQRTAAGKPVPKYWTTAEELAKFTAALSIHALRQLLVDAAYYGRTLTMNDVSAQVEAFIVAQLGEDTVEFKRPEHTFADVIGARAAKAFIEQEVLRGLRLTTKDALASIIVCGPIGAGKTYLWEAVAAMLGIPVLVLKNLRSKWFGETDVKFERLRGVLEALSKVLIYVNEADTAFGGVGGDVHETERRLTGKLQAMMADAKLRGRVHWLLDTARAHQLSADIRRPGRGGDLIFPVFDPEGEDRADVIRWTVASVIEGGAPDTATFEAVDAATKGYSMGAFSSLRAELRRKAEGRMLTAAEVLAVVRDVIPPDIGLERRYQMLQAMLNCTRKSLLPEQFRKLEGEAWEKQRREWQIEVAMLEAQGIH